MNEPVSRVERAVLGVLKPSEAMLGGTTGAQLQEGWVGIDDERAPATCALGAIYVYLHGWKPNQTIPQYQNGVLGCFDILYHDAKGPGALAWEDWYSYIIRLNDEECWSIEQIGMMLAQHGL